VPLPDALVVGAPLVAHPASGIVVPVVTAVGDRAECGIDRFPATIAVERALDGVRDVGASATAAYPAIELTNQPLVQRNVHSHGHNVTHSSVTRVGR
jgi:hypothetical protein